MTDNHLIIPSSEMMDEWCMDFYERGSWRDIAIKAAQWGADQELEACCEWLVKSLSEDPQEVSQELCAARRPKPPSLKERALAKLPEHPESMASYLSLSPGSVAIIRRALEQL